MIRYVTLQADQIEAAKCFLSIAGIILALVLAAEGLFDSNKNRKRRK